MITGTDMFMSMITKKHGAFRTVILTIMAVILVIAALFVMWWKGIFIDKSILWNESEGLYGNGYYKLENKRLILYEYDENTDFNEVCIDDDSFISSLSRVWCTERNWFVQDVLIEDVDRDGEEELVALVWKHGSFGPYKPQWIKNNDIRLEQHIFIFRWDDTKDDKVRNVWMSSTIGYEIDSIKRYGDDKVLVNDKGGNNRVWYWADFGLKLAGEAKERDTSFLCVGDNLIHEWMYKYGDKGNKDKAKRTDYIFDDYYKNIKDYISDADFKVVCQETVLTEDENLISDYPSFAVPSNVGNALKNAGFNVFLLANNHMLDKGLNGVESTYATLTDKDCLCLGVNPKENYSDDFRNGIHFVVKDNIKIALLDYTEITNGMKQPEGYKYMVELLKNEKRMINQIRYAQKRADAVIVFAHWGQEYIEKPSDSQEFYAKLLIDKGADIIIGSHPHVLQRVEENVAPDGKFSYVFYSLGNFVSGQDKEKTDIGGMAEFEIRVNKSGQMNIGNIRFTRTIMKQNREEFGVRLDNMTEVIK